MNTRAVFVGNGSLLIQCAQAWLDAGHTIQAVATDNRAIREWAGVLDIVTVDVGDGATVKLPDVEFDYLFSVANLRVLPAMLIARAGCLAINFHDALLPRYAGLNATSWALLAQETMHGVTWHEMTPTIDAGRIVRQASFPIAATETALSLNAKCYEAGLATFVAMLQDIGQGSALALAAQAGAGEYVGRWKRPDDLATLDFSRSAKELSALVRGLDFGPYANPLARPKIYLGDKLLWVRTAQALAHTTSVSSAPPVAAGTVLNVGDDMLRVATGDGDIVLGGFSDGAGRAAPHGLARGVLLPALDAGLREKLAMRLPQVARGDVFWSEAFSALAAIELPYPRKNSVMQSGIAAQLASTTRRNVGQRVHVGLQVTANGPGTVAAFFAWLSALTGQQKASVQYCDAVLCAQAAQLECWLSPWVPLTLETSGETSTRQAVADAEIQITRCRTAGPWQRDLPSRMGESPPAFDGLRSVGIRLDGGSAPDDIELLLTVDPAGHSLELQADGSVFSESTVRVMAGQLAWYLGAFEAASGSVAQVSLVPPAEAQAIAAGNRTAMPYDTAALVHDAISARAAHGDSAAQTAIRLQDLALSYRELEEQASRAAGQLLARGVRPGDIVGVCLERTPALVVAVLAVLKAGAAYLPLDPDYPHERIAFMIEDSKTALVISSPATAGSLGLSAGMAFFIGEMDLAAPTAASAIPASASASGSAPVAQQTSDSAAYVIYTSGSTGRPKGVVVTHRNVMNFFAGMDQRVPHDPPGRWLAVTSLSFDISVLELCWTLTRGFTIELHSTHSTQLAHLTQAAQAASAVPAKNTAPEFSLYYFGGDDSAGPADRYKLLMEGAKFADAAGFAAVWTPERHFHAFGGLYPNPALTSAAIAAVTTRVKIRAGSCVLPLHHPIRVAEEWAFVDNISQGRVGVSFAPGWQPNDFVIAPQAFATRKADMLANIDVVRRLWRGEGVGFPGPLGETVPIQTLPRPVQRELPVWLTAAGNPETFRQAGTLGCHVLTHLLGQSLDEVAGKLQAYRAAWREAGHSGQGHATLMLHTFVGPDETAVRERVRGPMKEYLRSSVDLIRQAAWTFPAFVQRAAADGSSPADIMNAQTLSEGDMEALLEHAFNRYYVSSALFGTPERCLAMIGKLRQAGVDEIACLIDFGIDTDTVLAHLHHLKQLMDAAQVARTVQATQPVRPAGHASGQPVPVAREIIERGITHLQCTPSMASMLVADAAGRSALSRLSALLVGGEALPLKLAKELRALVPGALLNMYGPTETTVWSTTCALTEIGDFVPLGQPIANTWLQIRTPGGAECPMLVAGELFIGGDGVTRGYLHRDALTAERFSIDPGNPVEPGGRLYRTGDLVRRHPDGALEFLGRIDQQVKIRGHRIELGEIESALLAQPGVKDAAVVAHDDDAGAGGGQSLVAYVTAVSGALPDGTPNASPDATQLQRALAQSLPQVMVPAAVHLLQAFPLTPNGKVDRRALARLSAAPIATAIALPKTQVERIVAGIWKDVLGRSDIGVNENFFDVGGHSLLVVQVQRRLRDATGHEISIADMFRLASIHALATYLSGAATHTAVADGLNRAQARRGASRSRPSLQSTPTG